MKKLPIGIQTFSDIIREDYVYVDKTKIAIDLIRNGKYYFLSRPRRFGKSLFLDTLKEIFEGNKALFEGLHIYDQWDWTQSYPVIKIDFAEGTLQSRAELDEIIYEILEDNQHRLNLQCSVGSIRGRMGELIRRAKEKYGNRPVVLVDEYDKPILDNIDKPGIAAEMREGLKNLYSVFKGQDAHLQFVFMTGVSKFSKVSLFSGINQLLDITLDGNFSAICGYTQEDLERGFAMHLKGVDLEKLRIWYNGYKWLGSETLYNPYDILLFIHKKFSYRNYWFETGNPSFLVRLFEKNGYFLPSLEDVEVTEEILDSFDVERINPLTLLFQTGYLTIDTTFIRRQRMMFKLKIPNLEVKIALNDQFINGYTDLVNEKIGYQNHLYTSLVNGNPEEMIGVIRRLFASIPWRNFTKNNLPDVEGYYASVLYAFFSSLDARIIPEDITSHGQVDLTVKLAGHVYVMEIKVVNGRSGEDGDLDGRVEKMDQNSALKQIREKGYAKKYLGEKGVKVHEVGLIFSRKRRNLVSWAWECSSS